MSVGSLESLWWNQWNGILFIGILCSPYLSVAWLQSDIIWSIILWSLHLHQHAVYLCNQSDLWLNHWPENFLGIVVIGLWLPPCGSCPNSFSGDQFNMWTLGGATSCSFLGPKWSCQRLGNCELISSLYKQAMTSDDFKKMLKVWILVCP